MKRVSACAILKLSTKNLLCGTYSRNSHMSHTKLTNCERDQCMAYLLANYDEWPSADGLSPGAATHHGYHWCKFDPDRDWVLSNTQNDTISKAEFHVAYFEDIRMEHHFDQKFLSSCAKMLNQSKGNTRGYDVTLSRAQLIAMCHAIAEYDIAKDKLTIARRVAFKLNGVLTP